MTSRIRIAFVIDRLSLPSGGTERQLLHLIAGLDPSRFQAEVFCLQSSEWLTRGGSTNAPTHMLDCSVSRHPRVLRDIWRFAREIRRRKFDIVQTHFRDSNIIGVSAAALARSSKIVSARRGVGYWQTAFGRQFTMVLNRQTDAFLANSQATKRLLTRTERVEPSRIRVIHNGVDTDIFRRPPQRELDNLASSLGISSETPVVGIVANLRAVKGVDVFIRAAATVVTELKDARFLVIGDGLERERLKALTIELGLNSQVFFLGARADVPSLLHLLDVGVLASHFESFSNSILEYLAAGLPVVVTAVGGAREVVTEGLDGYIVRPNDADAMARRIVQLLQHPAGARAWPRRQGLPSEFHIDAMVTAHEAFYYELLRKAR